MSDRAELVSLTLWQRLSEIFLGAFLPNYGDIDSPTRQTWKKALSTHSEESIRLAIERCKHWEGKYPPNLPEFLRLCRMETAHQPFKPEPEKPLLEHLKASANSPIARRELARIEALMADRSEFEFEGRTYQMETREQCYHALGLGAWWGNLKGASC